MAGIAKTILNKLFMENGELSTKAVLGTGLTAYSAISEYNDSRQEGNGIIGSAASAAGDAVLMGLVNPWVYLAGSAIAGAASHGVEAYDSISAYGRQLQAQKRNIPFQNATFLDSQQTYTMRQAGMNLARQGQFAAQQTTLGNEASSVSYIGR